MITIIEQGKNTQSVELDTFEAKCPLCDCKFAFDNRDLETFYGNGKTVEGVRCPNCGNVVYNNHYESTGNLTIEVPIKDYATRDCKDWKDIDDSIRISRAFKPL